MTRTLRGMSGFYTTSLAASQNPLSESGAWKNGLSDGSLWTDVRAVLGRMLGTQDGGQASIYQDSIAALTGAFTSNQQATALVYNSTSRLQANQEVELHVHSNITPGSTRVYEFTYEVTGKYMGFVRWQPTFGSFNEFIHVDNVTALVSGDKLDLTISGNILNGFLNGNLVLSGSDPDAAPYQTGTPGVGFFAHNIGGDTADITKYGFTSFTAKSLLTRLVSNTRAVAAARTIAS